MNTTVIKTKMLNLKTVPKTVFTKSYELIPFFILVVIFMTKEAWSTVCKLPLLKHVLPKINLPFSTQRGNFMQKISDKIEAMRPFQVRRSYLISLAYNNLKIKRTRSLITILGMAIGIGIIVYLLSLGYGIERLVIKRVASLQELKMADVLPGETSNAKLTKKMFEKITAIQEVKKTIPLVSIVGKVNFNNARIDILTYAVTDEYLEIQNQHLLKGKMFTDKGDYLAKNKGSVQGVSTELQNAVYNTLASADKQIFNVLPQKTLTVWEDCSTSAKILGYITRTEGNFEGYEYWGGAFAPYYPNGRVAYDEARQMDLGLWLKAVVPLSQKMTEGELQPVMDENGRQKWEMGCLPKKDLYVYEQYKFGQVLGESTSATESASTTTDTEASASAELAQASNYEVVSTATSSGGIEFVSLQASDSALLAKEKEIQKLTFETAPQGVALISSGLANLLGISTDKALNSEFKISFILVRNLLNKENGSTTTEERTYKIIGIIDDTTKEYLYIPLSDVQKAGVQNYSQIKVIVNNQNKLALVRKNIETLGLKTNSASDTVTQIEGLFSNLRIFLVLLGAIALGVAALGMFNTLTVSLLERTREIGGMKAMGMISTEIQELFLAEALIMGFTGGIFGLLLGFLGGQLTSFLISLIAIVKGTGYLQLSYVPLQLAVIIILASFIIGLLTGVYPSIRARKISALNALRYE